MKLLAGDIGGTSSRFQWFDTEDPGYLSPLFCYKSGGSASFGELLKALFLDSGLERADLACFGLPGPGCATEVALTNLPWRISVDELKRQLPLGEVTLINDFHAAALGIDSLEPKDLICLHPGDFDPLGNRLVVGAGTGLGVEPVCQLEGQFYPQPSEGGHMAFAPQNAEQDRLLAWLRQLTGQVSYECLLSGDGLERIYRFHSQQRSAGHPLRGLTAADVHTQAEAGDEVATSALRTFVNIYAQFIVDAALLWQARAGIYIAGGIAAKIARWMQGDDFTRSFLAERSMSELVEKMPVYLVRDELLGLKGAMSLARRQAVNQPSKEGR